MKAKIFVGPRDSGKSRVAEMIADHVGHHKTVLLNGKEFTVFRASLFSEVSENTELIVFDDAPINFDYTSLLVNHVVRYIEDEILFKIKREVPGSYPIVYLVPQIIITTQQLSEKWLDYVR